MHYKLLLYSWILHLFPYSVCLLFSVIFFFILILYTRAVLLPSSLPPFVEFGSEFSKSNNYGNQVSPDITDHLVFVSVGKLRQS